MAWLVFILLTAGGLALVLTPLLRRRARERSNAEFDVAVYRDQLGEVDRDAERGLLTPEQAEAAKAEISRRLLRAADDTGIDAAPSSAGGLGRWAPVAAIAIAVPVVALGSYAVIGNPDLGDRPFAERTDLPPPQQTADARNDDGVRVPHSLEGAVEELARRMADNPLNLDGWVMLGRSYMELGRYADAAEAYRHAVALARGRPEISASRGEALVAANDGAVTEDAAKAFAAALERNPFDTKSLYYTGLQKAQRGDMEGAVQSWTDLAAISPPDAPWLPTVREHITRAAGEAGIDAATVKSMMNLESPEDEARIREMAARLKSHLTDHPDNQEGWGILARTYRVLGDEAEAKEAQTTADALVETARLEQERRQELGGKVSPEDQERIRTMVQGLADRLEQNPEDEAGWRMLARSYDVLGETEKAREALAKADALAAKTGTGRVGPAPRQGQPLQGLPPEEQARIRTMVQRLADRLAQNPNDEQGWRMLARSYQVLGQSQKAAEALSKADALAAKESQGAAPPPQAAPTPRQGQARQGLPPEEQARIRAMVQRLADRLAQNPDDEQGWRMLARSYQVLGQSEKAAEAIAKADALANK